MHQLSSLDCNEVGGAGVVALLGLGVSVINAAPGIREFFDGLFDGIGRI